MKRKSALTLAGLGLGSVALLSSPDHSRTKSPEEVELVVKQVVKDLGTTTTTTLPLIAPNPSTTVTTTTVAPSSTTIQIVMDSRGNTFCNFEGPEPVCYGTYDEALDSLDLEATTTVPLVRTKTDADIYYESREGECPIDSHCHNDEKQPTLSELVDQYFLPEDREWALQVAFCESSAQPEDRVTDALNPDSQASGWFQHMPEFWEERSTKAGFSGFHIMDGVANVGVAAYVYYEMGGDSHWKASQSCWD